MSVKEINKLEDDFEKLVEEYKSYTEEPLLKINENLKLARTHLDKAVKISNEFGVPFTSPVSPIFNTYSPGKLNSKFNLSLDIINDICQTDICDDYPGWEHSQVC